MNDLDDFDAGFHDGYQNRDRDKTRGGVYQRAYKAGLEAAKRTLELSRRDTPA